MPRRTIDDEVCLTINGERRWWRLSQPRPTIAFALQGRISACLGPAADQAVRAMLAGDEQGEADLAADPDEAMAMQAFRRARTGGALLEPGEDASVASMRLRAVLRQCARVTGVRLDAALLLGEHERDPAEKEGHGYRWARYGLAYRLLLDSDLRFGGGGPRFAEPPREDSDAGRAGHGADSRRLEAARATGSVGRWIAELDEVVSSADELALLCTWAILHLFRPF